MRTRSPTSAFRPFCFHLLVQDPLLVGGAPGERRVRHLDHGGRLVAPSEQDVVREDVAVLAGGGAQLEGAGVDEVAGLGEHAVQLAEGHVLVLGDHLQLLLHLGDQSLHRTLALGEVRGPKHELGVPVSGELLDLLLVQVLDGLGQHPVRADDLPAEVRVVLARLPLRASCFMKTESRWSVL